MASGNNSANSNNSNNAKEQLLVCWLEPQSDAGKVSAIPASWIVSTVSGDGRSPDSVVRCRWPRTKRLYRARIVSPADQQSKSPQEQEEEEEPENGTEPVVKKPTKEEPVHEPVMVASANMVKEETKATRNSQQQQQQQSPAPPPPSIPTTVSSNSTGVQATAPMPTPQQPVIDPAAIAQALLPTLKKLFNNELTKLSTDIQANFDIIGHKISALDGTVKCIKTRVDRMETLLNTAAQELGDNQPMMASSASIGSLGLSSPAARSSPMNNSDLLSGAVRNLTNSNIGHGNANANANSFYSAQHQNRTPAGTVTSSRYPSSVVNSAPARNAMVATPGSNTLQQRRPAQHAARFAPQSTLSTTPNAIRAPTANSGFSSFSRQPPNSMVSVPTTQRPGIPGSSSSAPSSLKRRRTTPTTNPPLPKAVVITAPNGIDIFLGGDKNYKMPLVMYKDALKNCTRPIATYMVMALIRRYLTPDEMSRTWLTEQQLLGKKDGILLDQNLLTALKKQALMQFPGTGMDDRLLVRKLYDVFHGIRRQMRKKRREAGDSGPGDGGISGDYGNEHGDGDLGGLGDHGGDDESGSGNDHDHEDGMDDDSHHLEHGSGEYNEDHANDFEGDEYGQDDNGLGDMVEGGDMADGGEEDGDDGAGFMGDGVLNGDEDLEEMAAKQAAFWAGTDEGY